MGCLVIPGAFGGGLATGLLVSGTLNYLTANQQLAQSVGAGVGFISSLLLFMYGPLWIGDPESVLPPPKSTSLLQQWRDAKVESKLQSAEIRCGIVFALIGGVSASGANASNSLIYIVVIGSSMLGGLAGYDLKRRVVRLRRQLLPADREKS